MLDQNVNSYGVLETREGSDPIDLQLEELRRQGCTVLDSGIDSATIDEMREKLAAVYERQSAELEAASLAASDDADVARCPLAYDPVFLDLATTPALLRFCARVFGENFVLLQQNGVINRPSKAHYQLKWHRDLPFQHWVASKPLAIACLFCLDPFDAITGGTYALPGSHRDEGFPSEAFVRAHQNVMTAAAGSFIVMDAMMFHRAGRNTSDRPRLGVNHLIGLPFLAQQIDIPRMLDGAHAKDPVLASYLGYKWNPAPSIDAWRSARITRT
jgi:ectoine hydroxylase-related dioxygenase (phytanoyl-CoA dioxygenase family)